MKVSTDACLFGAWASQLLSVSSTRQKPGQKVLDLGTGTGLLPLMLAQKNGFFQIDAIEIDEGAAGQAGENVNASKWKERIHVIAEDARTFPFGKKYDIIISNPPFYENELKSANHQKNIAHHGQELSFSELLNLIPHLLKPGGEFYLLLPYKREKEIERICKESGLEISTKVLVRQSHSRGYFRLMLRGILGTGLTPPVESEISIWDEHRQYTPEFGELMRDFYL